MRQIIISLAQLESLTSTSLLFASTPAAVPADPAVFTQVTYLAYSRQAMAPGFVGDNSGVFRNLKRGTPGYILHFRCKFSKVFKY